MGYAHKGRKRGAEREQNAKGGGKGEIRELEVTLVRLILDFGGLPMHLNRLQRVSILMD